MGDQRIKVHFEDLTARFYYQLLHGCSDTHCDQLLCVSCKRFKVKISAEAAAVLAIQYASKPSLASSKLCPRVAALPIAECKTQLMDLLTANKQSSDSSAGGRGSSIWQSPLYKLFLASLPIGKQRKSSTAAVEPAEQTQVGSSSKIKRLSRTESLDFTLLRTTASLHADPDSDQTMLQSLNGLTLRSSSRIKSDYDLPSLNSLSQKLATRLSSEPAVSASETAAAPESGQQTAVSLAYFKELIAKKSVDEVSSRIKATLGSVQTLARSFSGDASHSGLDLVGIRDTYELLSSHSFTAAVAEATEQLLVQLEGAMGRVGWNSLLPGHWMRAFVVLAMNPLLAQKTYFDSLTRQTCRLLGSMRRKPKTWLIDSLSDMPPSIFSAAVRALQDYLSATFGEVVHSPNDTCVYCVKALGLFYIANELRDCAIVPPDVFYNANVCAKTNFKEEYKHWQKLLQGKQPISEFSVFFFPFLLPPDEKVRVLHIDAMAQMSSRYEDAFVKQALVTQAQRFLPESAIVDRMEKNMLQVGMTNPYLLLEVRRTHLVADTLQQLTRKLNDVKKPLKVKFVGGGEEGMDQGGVQKEFFQVLMDALLDPEYGMFVADSETRYLWFNAFSLEPLSSYELVGVILGLALYNGVHMCLPFAPFVYKKLLGKSVGLSDMHVAFPSLARGLEQLLEWSEGDVAHVFMRTFSIEYATFGTTRHFELCDQGDQIAVTNENRDTFVKLYVDHYLSKSVETCFDAFRRGFWRAVGTDAVKLCTPTELEQLLCGSSELDFHELEASVQYEEFQADSRLVKDFWHIVHNVMTPEQRRLLLVFVTASDRVPLRGLGKVQFVLQRNGPDTERLPSALTCFGRLLLPEYSSREKLQEKLLTAIQNAKGFGLV